MNTKQFTVVIADDHPIFRQGLVKIVASTDDFKVIGEAGDGLEALRLIEEKKPDIVVVDISMPSMNGLELIKVLKENKYGGKFIILTMYREEEYFDKAFELGINGYILKECATMDFLKCLREVAAEKYYVSPDVSNFLYKKINERELFKKKYPAIELLTPSERRILKLIAKNKTSKEIAEILNISYRTVQNHRTHICEKLGLEGFNKLLQFALEHKDLL